MNPGLSHPYTPALMAGALFILPWEFPKWVWWHIHHLLRGFGLR